MAVGILLLAPVAAARAGQGTLAFEHAPLSGYGSDAVVAPDGSIVRVGRYDYDPDVNAQRLQRLDVHGRLITTHVPRGVSIFEQTPIVLTDGAIAFTGWRDYDPSRPSAPTPRMVVTLSPSGGRVTAVPLPGSGGASDWSRPAIAPDGAGWMSEACRGLLSRTAPNGTTVRIRIRHVGCNGGWNDRQGDVFAFGPDGTTWFASLCTAWIARIPLVGRVRVWRLPPRPGCVQDPEGLDQPHPGLLPTAVGGLRFEGGHIDPRGRLVRNRRETLPDAVAPDGAEWRLSEHAIERRAADGKVMRFVVRSDPELRFVGGAVGPDGRFWYLAAYLDDELSAGTYNAGMRLGVLDAAGNGLEQALPSGDDWNVSTQPLADAGGMLLSAPGDVLRATYLRVPRGVVRARARRVVVRRGTRIWLQVACAAHPGLFCTGRVRLASRFGTQLVRPPGGFAISAGETQVVPLRLTLQATRLLSGGRPLPAVAVVVMHDGSRTRKRVVVP